MHHKADKLQCQDGKRITNISYIFSKACPEVKDYAWTSRPYEFTLLNNYSLFLHVQNIGLQPG